MLCGGPGVKGRSNSPYAEMTTWTLGVYPLRNPPENYPSRVPTAPDHSPYTFLLLSPFSNVMQSSYLLKASNG